MRLHIRKWGNSLAVRLPADYIRASSLQNGDILEAAIGPTGEITLTPSQSFDKAAFLKKIRKLRASMPMTSATVESMRLADRY